LIWWASQLGWFAIGSGWMIFTSIIAFVYPVLALCGDFYESHMKRVCGVKDSAEAIDPNRVVLWGRHGGANDRLDSMIGGVAFLATPIVVFFASDWLLYEDQDERIASDEEYPHPI
jgi:CDP-diglyceride synthetase